MRAYWKGSASCVRGDFDTAIVECTKAIELAPTLAKAYCYRGRAYWAKGKSGRVLVDCSEAIRIAPND